MSRRTKASIIMKIMEEKKEAYTNDVYQEMDRIYISGKIISSFNKVEISQIMRILCSEGKLKNIGNGSKFQGVKYSIM